MNILHITTHMGGGVGHAISGLVLHDKQNVNGIVLLQKPEKTKYVDLCIEDGVAVYTGDSVDVISTLMSKADIVILHWWHHPVMCKFLYCFPDVPVRLVLWSHVSGCTYPLLFDHFIDKFAKVFFTSKYSLENMSWSESVHEKICNNSSIIYGLGDLPEMLQKKEYGIKHGKFKIGYVGTLARSKIHPEFPCMCKKILSVVPNAEFYLLGDMDSGAWILDEANQHGITDHIHFEGFADNVNKCLTDFDVFGYPLNPYHFGTTENSILEAMSVGLPVVLLDQATEKYIVTHKKDGILANGTDDYIEWISFLAANESLRRQLGFNASKSVYEKFSFKKNLECFQKEVNTIALNEPKRICFDDVLGDTPYDWFLSAVSERDKAFLKKCTYYDLPFIFSEKSKSSIVHFADSYPQDQRLKESMRLLRGH